MPAASWSFRLSASSDCAARGITLVGIGCAKTLAEAREGAVPNQDKGQNKYLPGYLRELAVLLRDEVRALPAPQPLRLRCHCATLRRDAQLCG